MIEETKVYNWDEIDSIPEIDDDWQYFIASEKKKSWDLLAERNYQQGGLLITSKNIIKFFKEYGIINNKEE